MHTQYTMQSNYELQNIKGSFSEGKKSRKCYHMRNISLHVYHHNNGNNHQQHQASKSHCKHNSLIYQCWGESVVIRLLASSKVQNSTAISPSGVTSIPILYSILQSSTQN